MEFFLLVGDYISRYSQYYNKWFKNLTLKAFQNKLIYYAVYDKNTEKYHLIHDHSGLLYTLYYYISNNWMKFDFAGITYNDLNIILQCTNFVAVVSYVRNNRLEHNIFDMDTYQNIKNIKSKVIYAYSDNNEDLTHEFEKFKNTIFDIKLGNQDLYNLLMSYKKINREKINSIKVMMDDTFEEFLM